MYQTNNIRQEPDNHIYFLSVLPYKMDDHPYSSSRGMDDSDGMYSIDGDTGKDNMYSGSAPEQSYSSSVDSDSDSGE
jgi:hypothetical protein